MVDKHGVDNHIRVRDAEDKLLNSSLLTNNKDTQRPMSKIERPPILSKSEIREAVNKIIVKIQTNHCV